MRGSTAPRDLAISSAMGPIDSWKRAGTSPVNAVVRETMNGKAGPSSVERLKMDLPFATVSRVQYKHTAKCRPSLV